MECGNASARKPYRDTPNRLRQTLEAAGLLVAPTEQDWNDAWRAYEAGVANSAGIVDQVSFIVMAHLGLKQVFTNDGHFRAVGFETLF